MDTMLITVLDRNISEQLIARGFSYMKTNINNKEAYAFPCSADILNYIQTDIPHALSDGSIVCENVLRF